MTTLEVRGLVAGYGSIVVLPNLDLRVEAGEVVVLLGANGAGKTTSLLTISGAIPALDGRVLIDGMQVRSPAFQRARRGLAFVTEERSVFMRLTTLENLRVGRGDIEGALDLFPELRPKLSTRAGLLSGGEQQMLSLARALSRRPRLLLADELSLGLAPLVVERLLDAVRSAADARVAVLIVEQHAERALRIADRAYVLRRGKVELEGTAAEIRGRIGEVRRSYLSHAVGDRARATDDLVSDLSTERAGT